MNGPIEQNSVVEINRLKNLPYDEYLMSEHWLKVRNWMLKFSGHRCQMCGATSGLGVHHNNYGHLGEESRYDLAVVCVACHARHHGKEVSRPEHKKLSKKERKRQRKAIYARKMASMKEGRKCRECGATLYKKMGPYGEFWACPAWPNCKARNNRKS